MIDFSMIMNPLGAVTDLVGNIMNYKATKDTNQANLDYSKWATQEQWARDDRAIQTQVNDALKAGLSPLAVVNGGGATVTQAMPYNAQSPNFNFSDAVTSLVSWAKQNETTRHNKAQEEQAKAELQEQIQNNIAQLNKDYDLKIMEDETKNAEINATIKNMNKQQETLLKIAEMTDTRERWTYELDTIKEQANKAQENYNNICNTLGFAPATEQIEINNYEDYQTYIEKLNNWTTHYLQTIGGEASEMNYDKESKGSGSSNASGWNAGVSANVKKIAGAGIDGGYSSSTSGTTTESIDRTRNNSMLMSQILSRVKYPIPVIMSKKYYGTTD